MEEQGMSLTQIGKTRGVTGCEMERIIKSSIMDVLSLRCLSVFK
jgi:hypothetical protein